ncbi:hypothetical protein ACHAXH_006143 [Discostella pseudostelligera]
MSAAPLEVSFPSFLSPPPTEAVVAPAPAPSQQQQLPLPASVAPPPKATLGRAVAVSTAGLGAKRPAASAASAPGQPKRQKGAAQTSASTARGKVAGLPRTNSMNAAPKLAKPTLPPMAVPPPGVVRAPTAATAALAASIKSQAGVPSVVKSIVHQKDKMPVGGGINHQVVARPSAVPSSASAVSATAAVTHHRNISPVFSITAAAADGSVSREGKSSVVATSTSSTGPKPTATEADFKDVASAAVSCLIQNASSTSSLGSMLKPTVKSNEKIDTSTAHITALTSQNWVTACNPTPCPDSPPSSSSAVACDKAARNARRATLSQEDRAKQNRDRNREHARNTRLRKKAYVEELKRTLTEMVSQRDAADLEKRHEAQRNREQREVRFRVMEEFLNLRGRNELNAARWVAILEDGFMFTLPRTPYRRMVDGEKSWSSDVYGNGSSCVEQLLRGAAAVVEDSAHLSTFLQSFGGSMMGSLSSSTSAAAAAAPQVQIVYKCDRKRFFMDGNVTFMDFTANTLGAVARGAPNEVVFKGSMSALFSPASNKLISIDMTFDSGSIAQQIEAMGNVVVSSMNDAATTAAHEAGALLDSLQMPQMYVDKTLVSEAGAAGPVSVSSDDGERSTDSSSAAPINS